MLLPRNLSALDGTVPAEDCFCVGGWMQGIRDWRTFLGLLALLCLPGSESAD